jgi:alkylated DNA repair dioxygenase AlkB
MHLFHNQESGIWTFPVSEENRVSYMPDFIPLTKREDFLTTLWETCNWKQEYIQFGAQKIAVPRLSAWYTRTDGSYSYSGIKMEANPYFELLTNLENLINTNCSASFNSVLVNAYRTEHDSVGWHADDETELGQAPKIASVSLGESRMFHIRRKGRGQGTRKFLLESGSLLFMDSGFQSDWEHMISKSKTPKKLRINLTFRQLFI